MAPKARTQKEMIAYWEGWVGALEAYKEDPAAAEEWAKTMLEYQPPEGEEVSRVSMVDLYQRFLKEINRFADLADAQALTPNELSVINTAQAFVQDPQFAQVGVDPQSFIGGLMLGYMVWGEEKTG